MTYETENAGTQCTVVMAGDVDISCKLALQTLESQLAGSERVVVNVSGVRYSDTTFLHFLLKVRKRPTAPGGAQLTLVGVNPQLRRVLEATGLQRLFAA